MAGSLAGRLVAECGEDRVAAGVVVRAVYRPSGGGERVMPPTFPTGTAHPDDRSDQAQVTKYLFERRWVDGEKKAVVVLDQVPSQANRVEEALLSARDKGRLRLPLFELAFATSRGPIRLTSLDFPHRYADAYLRDSLVDGVRFDKSAVGQRIRTATVDDVRPLYEREPCSLLFGAWDSHRKGRWPKFARLYTSSVFGIDPLLEERRGGRYDPVNMIGAVDDSAKQEGDWGFVAEAAKKKGGKLSEIGHGHIAPNATPGGVTVTEARRAAWVSFAGLERLRFGDAPPEAAALARAALTALALAGDRLAFGRPSVWLRSGCDLTVIRETVGFELAGGAVEEFEATTTEVIGAFHELRDEAAAAGVAMADDVIALEPIPALAKAVEHSVAQAAADGE